MFVVYENGIKVIEFNDEDEAVAWIDHVSVTEEPTTWEIKEEKVDGRKYRETKK